MKTTIPKLRRMIRKVIKEAINPVTGSGAQEVDEAIISKLTGKAAVYLTGIVTSLNS